MSSPGVSQPDRAGLAPEWQRAFAWIERTLGGRLVSWERQARWRPAWFLQLERAGERLPLYFRGDRGEADHGIYPLEREMRVLQVLEEHGIPVPHVYGFCPEPRGIVMECAPGRANLATAESQAEREAVLDHYIEILARMHRLELAPFEAIGLERPGSPDALALGDFDVWEKSYRATKCRPEPLVEFVIGWVRRNLPPPTQRLSFLACDSGQFLFERGRVTALLDLELAALGDPAADLAGLRTRDLSEPLGDLRRALGRYVEFGGEAVDPRVIDFHTVRFAVCTPMVVGHLVAQPSAGLDFVQYLSWYLVYSRAPIEVIARRLGVPLDPIPLVDPEPSRHAPGHEALAAQLEGPVRCAAGDAYPAELALRTAAYLRRAERLGPALEAQDLDEVAPLLGRRPKGWTEADRALEELVIASGDRHEPELARYFYRRMLRQEAIVGPELRELEGVAVQPID